MENVIIGNKEILNDLLLSKEKTIIVDFWAPWCSPCRTISPILDQLAEENKDLQIVKINVDENSELSTDYSIRSIPAIFIFKNGEIKNNFVGLKNKEEILNLLK